MNLWTACRVAERAWLMRERPAEPLTRTPLKAVLTATQDVFAGVSSWVQCTLGLDSRARVGKSDDADYFLNGYGPATPLINDQLDALIAQHVLRPMRIGVLRQLSAVVHRRRREDIVSIFLVMYILLHNVECQIARNDRAMLPSARGVRR